MGLFSNKQPSTTARCKLCDAPLTTADERTIGLCTTHALIMTSDIEEVPAAINRFQPLSNAATDPDEKVMYLKLMLDYLYKVKIKYYENGIKPLEQDIDETIDTVVNAISEART